MPSLDHEALLELFRGGTRLASEVLRGAFDIRVPDAEAVPIEANFSQLVPTEYRADLVLAIGPSVRVIVEVQLRRDDRKRWTWPLYVTALRARDRCKVYLLVVTTSAEVAAWARAPVEPDAPRSWLDPLVIGPGSFPRITDIETAHRMPELAVLSALTQTDGPPDVKVGVAALAAALGLDSERGAIYGDLVLRWAGEAAVQVVEALMSISSGKYEFKSEFTLKYIQQGRLQGRSEGLEEGLERGLERGLEQGRLEATAQAIVTILAGRGLALSDDQRQSILGCTDSATLDRWLRLSISASSADELLRATDT